MNCTRCSKRLSRKTARQIDGVVMCSTCMFAPAKRATLDSKDYRHTFYGLLNAQGAFWTPLVFESKAEAEAHLARFVARNHKRFRSILSTHAAVPVRVRIEALPAIGDRSREAAETGTGSVHESPGSRREIAQPLDPQSSDQP